MNNLYHSGFKIYPTDKVIPIEALSTIRQLEQTYYYPYQNEIQHCSFEQPSLDETVPVKDYSYVLERMFALRALATHECAKGNAASPSRVALLLNTRHLYSYVVRTRMLAKAKGRCPRCHRGLLHCRCVAIHKKQPPRLSQRLKNCTGNDRALHLRHRLSNFAEMCYPPAPGEHWFLTGRGQWREMRRDQAATVLVEILSTIDYVLGTWTLIHSRTPFIRNVGKKTAFLDAITGGCGIGSPPELTPDAIYLCFRLGTRQLYVGQTGGATDERWYAHIKGSISDTTAFYRRNRHHWHEFVCIAVLKPSLLRYNSTFCRTSRTERESLEGLLMGLYNPSENTLGASTFHMGLIRSIVVRTDDARDVRRRAACDRGPFIGGAYLDVRRGNLIYSPDWHSSYAGVITSFRNGGQIDLGRMAVSKLSREADRIPTTLANELIARGVGYSNRLLKAQRFMSPQRYYILRTNLQTIFGSQAGNLRDPCGVRTIRWPWIAAAKDVLDDFLKLLQTVYKRTAAEKRLYLNQDSKTWRVNVRPLPAKSANSRWKTPLSVHRKWQPPHNCRCQSLLQKYGHLGIETVLVDGTAHICTRMDGPLAFNDPSRRCSSKTKLRPDTGVQRRAFIKETLRLLHKLDVKPRGHDTSLFRFVAHAADEMDRRRLSVPTFSEVWNTAVLDDLCKGYFVDTIDKPGELATCTISCREVYYAKARKFLGNGSYRRLYGWNSIQMSDPTRQFWRLGRRLEGDSPITETHKIATLRLPDKEKGLRAPGIPCLTAEDLKPRPVAAYLNHRYKIPLQYASKALGLLSRTTFPGRTYTSTRQWIDVVDGLNATVVSDPNGALFTVHQDADIDGFFNKINPADGIKEIQLALRQQRLNHGKRWYGFKRGLKTWVGRHFQANGIRQLTDDDCVVTTRRPDKRHYCTISCRDIVQLAKMDCTYNFQTCCGKVSQQTLGTPMGSPLGDRLSSFSAHMKEKTVPVRRGVARFVDDKAKNWTACVPSPSQVTAAGNVARAFLDHPTNKSEAEDPEMAEDFYPGLKMSGAAQNAWSTVHSHSCYLGCTVENVVVDRQGNLLAEIGTHKSGDEPSDILCRLIMQDPQNHRKILRIRQKPLRIGKLTPPFAYRTDRQSTNLVVSALHRAYRSASALPNGNREAEVKSTYDWYRNNGYTCSYRRRGNNISAYELFYKRLFEPD